MLNNAHHHAVPADSGDEAFLESLIRDDVAACHPGEALDDFKRRARFSKEDKGLLREWMCVAAARAQALGASPVYAQAAE